MTIAEHASSAAPFTDVENEEPDENGDGSGKHEPWDPALIRVDPKQFSLRQIIDMVDDADLDLAPDFQRHRVWKPLQKSRLIESVLLRIPLPAFYFSADNEGRMQVVDGLQRLSTIHGFAKDAFELDDLEYLSKELAGKKFSQLKDTLWGRRLLTTQITVNVIDPQTPPKVKFDIFRRINTLGNPLVPQEIRHCMSRARSRTFLRDCANMESFVRATGGSLLDHKRMDDREVVLRIMAFRMTKGSFEPYARAEGMDVFLTNATEEIDRKLSDDDLTRLRDDLDRAMRNAYKLFGEYAFRKWRVDDDRRWPMNKPLVEAWGVGLADYAWEALEPRKAAIVHATRDAMTNDHRFVDAISIGTGDVRKVRARFLRVREILERAGTGQSIRPVSDLLAMTMPTPRGGSS